MVQVHPLNLAPLREVRAEPHWRAVDFIADLHLSPQEPATLRAFLDYLDGLAHAPVDALFILGDLFEVWPGDDCLEAFAPPSPAAGLAGAGAAAGSPSDPAALAAADRRLAADCAASLRALSQRIPLYFLHGNRDFLLGAGFAAASGAQALADPAVLDFGPRKVLLSHGDALCLADVNYQRFRAQVRDPAWMAALLQRPLAEREALGRQLRAQSQALHVSQPTYADADPDLSRQWLQEAGAQVLVHGHTHRPATHDLGEGRVRWVLSDWDAAARPPRAQALRLDREGRFERVNLPASAASAA